MDGNTWTSNAKVAAAINRSQALGGGMVTLLADDGEQYAALMDDLAGCCSEQRLLVGGIADFKGIIDDSNSDSQPWAVQLTLKPLRAWDVPRLNDAERDGLMNAPGGWSQHVLESHDSLSKDLSRALDLLQECRNCAPRYTTKLMSEVVLFLEEYKR